VVNDAVKGSLLVENAMKQQLPFFFKAFGLNWVMRILFNLGFPHNCIFLVKPVWKIGYHKSTLSNNLPYVTRVHTLVARIALTQTKMQLLEVSQVLRILFDFWQSQTTIVGNELRYGIWYLEAIYEEPL
jgi:hypothetical protein